MGVKEFSWSKFHAVFLTTTFSNFLLVFSWLALTNLPWSIKPCHSSMCFSIVVKAIFVASSSWSHSDISMRRLFTYLSVALAMSATDLLTPLLDFPLFFEVFFKLTFPKGSKGGGGRALILRCLTTIYARSRMLERVASLIQLLDTSG